MKTETMINDHPQDLKDRSIYKLGGAAAVLVVATALAEIGITFLPGGYTTAGSVPEWFALLQNNQFLGLRNLGLLNIIMTTLEIPMLYSLYLAHRRVDQGNAALAVIIALLGSAVFYATNRAFAMLDLSNQYAIAATEIQRTTIEAAGQAMLSVGQSHTPGTFLAFFLSELGGIAISIVMLRGGVFNKAAAYAGIAGFGFLLAFDLLSSFMPALHDVILIPAMLGGIFNTVWYILTARRLFQLGRRG
jgi:hypothetical protein